MLTTLIRLLLRILAGAVLTTGAASAVVSTVAQDTAHTEQVAYKGPVHPEQHFTVAADVTMPKIQTFDVPTVVQPPKPKPKPAPRRVVSHVTQAVKAPQTASLPVQHVVTGDPKAYARASVGAGQYGCLLNLWNRESGWNASASNPGSGAYGIPQSLPGSKMSSAGSDWRTNPITQVKWGLSYISSVYGSPCAAWAHSNSFGWY